MVKGEKRKNLIEARKRVGMTQQQVADRVGIDVRYYKQIEYGERLGGINIWDKLEDMFSVHQRKLRETQETCHGKEGCQ